MLKSMAAFAVSGLAIAQAPTSRNGSAKTAVSAGADARAIRDVYRIAAMAPPMEPRRTCRTSARALSFEANSVRNTDADATMVIPCRHPVAHQSPATSAIPSTVFAVTSAASRTLGRELEPGEACAPGIGTAGASPSAGSSDHAPGRGGQEAARRILDSSSSPPAEEGRSSGEAWAPGRGGSARAARSPARRLSRTSSRRARSASLTFRRRPRAATKPEMT
jgi:hypothetical protein